jgi:demethylmenaquinone methyltransferase/2-methoxy-6-polyprenyl-1,4-benzoquinol methylase
VTAAQDPGPEAARGVANRESADTAAAREAVAQEAIRTGNTVPEPSVTSMFDSIAPVYDRMNTLMTAGMDGRWRRAAVRAANLSKGGTALDVACGTGKLTAALAAKVGPEGRVEGVDLSPAMLDEARRAFGSMPGVEFVLGNALSLPVADRSFDAATIAFGLRNLASFEDGFREMARAVRSGGRVVCLELSVPRPRFMGRFYVALFRITAPFIGALFRRRAAYAYLPSSLKGFPPAEEIAATMRRVGLEDVRFKRLGLGSVALHWGTVA